MMSLFVPKRQATLFIPETGPAHDLEKGHLFVVLTNRCQAGKHLLVPICTQRRGHDTTCLLGSGDHKFIKHPSFVSYSLADIFTAEILVKRVNDGDITYRGLMDDKIFARICTGLFNSPRAQPVLKKYYAENTPGKPI